MYVCNCNGIRERHAREAIEAGACRPAEVFRHCGVKPQCAKCVCDIKSMIEQQQAVLAMAAE